MATFKLLQDLYRFPGFVPQTRIRGFFGDPHAVVITLQRRRKNGLLCLWSAPLDLLRPAAPPRPRPLLWRQAGLPRLLPSQSPLPALPEREDRTPGMARRQSL